MQEVQNSCPLSYVRAPGFFNELSRHTGVLGQIGSILKRATGGPDHKKLLFREGPPQLQDIQQDLSTDCWFLAAVGSVLATCAGPKTIEEMFYDDGHGTVYVQLYDQNGIQRVVALDKERESSLFSIQSKYTSRSKLWVHLLERAFSELNPDLIQVGKRGSPENAFPALLGKTDWQTIPYRADLVGMPAQYLAAEHIDPLTVLARKDLLKQGYPAVIELRSGSVPNFQSIPSNTVTGQLPRMLHSYAVISPVEKNREGQEGVWVRNFLSTVVKKGAQLKDSLQTLQPSRLNQHGSDEIFFLPLAELDYWKVTVALPQAHADALRQSKPTTK